MVRLFGIVNITPDSFSDGGQAYLACDAIGRVEELIAEGADVVDIGGDSTRPGSQCCGAEEEWRRIQPVVERLAHSVSLSVDTHHAAVARRALSYGVRYINDVSGGRDPEMRAVVADSDATLIVVHSASGKAHHFGELSACEVVSRMRDFFEKRIPLLVNAGIPKERIVLDPGMGAFLSATAESSWAVLRDLEVLSSFKMPIMVGVSRKGFLSVCEGDAPKDRDALSAHIASLLAVSSGLSLYIRTHNVRLTREFLAVARRLRG